MAYDGLFIKGGTIYRPTFFRVLQSKYIADILHHINTTKEIFLHIDNLMFKEIYQRYIVDIFKDFFVRRKKEPCGLAARVKIDCPNFGSVSERWTAKF